MDVALVEGHKKKKWAAGIFLAALLLFSGYSSDSVSTAVMRLSGYKVQWVTITGRISTFGGDGDRRESGNPWSNLDAEGLAIWGKSDEKTLHNRGLLAIVRRPGLGLARRLDPESFYVSARWPGWGTKRRPWIRRALREATATIETPEGRTAECWPVDYGPAEWTGKALDLSPGLARYLKLKTGDTATLTVRLVTIEEKPK